MKTLKNYLYGDPSLLDVYPYDVYLMTLMISGEKLVDFWKLNVKRYFSRSRPAHFTKGGKFVVPKLTAQKAGAQSSLVNALTRPEIDTGTKRGVIGLRNIVKTNTKGEPVQLVKILMRGVPAKNNIHYVPSVGMVPGGEWKGFPATYWMRWDSVFLQQCQIETLNMHRYITRVEGQEEFRFEKAVYTDPGKVVADYRLGKIKSIGGKF